MRAPLQQLGRDAGLLADRALQLLQRLLKRRDGGVRRRRRHRGGGLGSRPLSRAVLRGLQTLGGGLAVALLLFAPTSASTRAGRAGVRRGDTRRGGARRRGAEPGGRSRRSLASLLPFPELSYARPGLFADVALKLKPERVGHLRGPPQDGRGPPESHDVAVFQLVGARGDQVAVHVRPVERGLVDHAVLVVDDGDLGVHPRQQLGHALAVEGDVASPVPPQGDHPVVFPRALQRDDARQKLGHRRRGHSHEARETHAPRCRGPSREVRRLAGRRPSRRRGAGPRPRPGLVARGRVSAGGRRRPARRGRGVDVRVLFVRREGQRVVVHRRQIGAV